MSTTEYTTDDNGIKTVTYSTSEPNVELTGVYVATVPADVINIVITGFTSIENGAFENKLTSVKSLTIGNSVRSIGDFAFYRAKKLETLNLGSGLETIGTQAFLECLLLQTLVIPDSVTSIGNYAFVSAISLTSLTLGSGLTNIPLQLFYNSPALTSLTIPNTVTSIGAEAFSAASSLTNLTLGTAVTTIGDRAFNQCSSLTSLTIPDSVTTIGEHAFYFPASLTTLTLGAGVTSIGFQAFYNIQALTVAYGIKNGTTYKHIGTSELVTNGGNPNTIESLNSITTLMSDFINEVSPPSSEWIIIAFPTITSTTIADDYSTITVTFSEDVYNTPSGTGELEADDFTLSISSGSGLGATLGSTTPSSISKNSSTTYTLGFTLSGTIIYDEVITVVPSSSASIFDIDGSAASTTQSNNTIAIPDFPIIVSTTIADDYSTITVTFSADIYNTSSGSGDLEADDFTLSISGDATLGSTTPSSILKISSTTYKLGFDYSLSGTKNAVITVVPSSSSSIFDLEGDAASTTQSNNTASLTFYPTIASTTISEDNSTITVTFSDDVYNTSSGTGDLEADDFTLSIIGGATLGSTTPSSILKINTTTYTLGFALSGIAYDEVITVVPSSSTSIFDIEGDAASTTQSNNTVNIRELFNINLTVLDSNISIGEVATFNKFIASSYTPNATLYFGSPLSLWTHFLRFYSDGDADITDEGVTLFSLQASNLIGTSLATTTTSATSGLYTPVSNTESVYTLNRISDISKASGTTEDPKSLLFFMAKLAKAIFGAEQTIDMLDNLSEMEISYATSIDGCAETISNYFSTDSTKTIYDSIGNTSNMKLRVAKEIYDFFSATTRLTMAYDARIVGGVQVPDDTIGCLITSNTGSGSGATVDVLMDDVNGSIDNITINTSGTGYMKGDSIIITTGNGAKIELLSLTDVQAHMLSGTLNDVDGISFPFHQGDKLHVKIELSNNPNQENVDGKNLDTIGNTITSVIDLIIKLV